MEIGFSQNLDYDRAVIRKHVGPATVHGKSVSRDNNPRHDLFVCTDCGDVKCDSCPIDWDKVTRQQRGV